MMLVLLMFLDSFSVGFDGYSSSSFIFSSSSFLLQQPALLAHSFLPWFWLPLISITLPFTHILREGNMQLDLVSFFLGKEGGVCCGWFFLSLGERVVPTGLQLDFRERKAYLLSLPCIYTPS
jgi:hypothetical protein